MIIYRAFDEVFRSWSHVAVLRALIDTQTGFTGNEVARISGMHPRSSLKALTSLEELGIVQRQRGGRDHIFTLNREHVLVQSAILPMYGEERKMRTTIYSRLSHHMKKYVISAAVFGSVAREEETAASDFDLCCIVQSEREKDPVREILNRAAAEMHKKFGIKLAPLFFTVREFKHKSRTKLVQDIAEYGKVLAGVHPKVLLHE